LHSVFPKQPSAKDHRQPTAAKSATDQNVSFRWRPCDNSRTVIQLVTVPLRISQLWFKQYLGELASGCEAFEVLEWPYKSVFKR
jgi:hypothetical protein